MYRCSPRENALGATGCLIDLSRKKRRNLCFSNDSERQVTLTNRIHPVEINSDNFDQFGQVYRYICFTCFLFHTIFEVVSWQYDGKCFSVDELQLEINRGTPRYYIFRKKERTLNFHKITYHKQVTQCLASVQDSPWYIVVARANFCIDNPPSLDDLVAFKVTGNTLSKNRSKLNI